MTISQHISKKSALQLFTAFAALFSGGFVYLTYRTEQIVMHHAIKSIGLGETVHSWRQSVTFVPSDWIVYCLPNALWSLAYILVTDTILTKHTDNKRLIAASIIPAIGVVSEFLQKANVLPGTFDLFDILAYSIPYVIYLLIIKTVRK